MTASARPRARQERAVATEEKILDAAEVLFAQQGFEAVTTKQLATTSGVATGALYHHFSGKDELYIAALERALSRRSAVPAALLDTSRDSVQRLTGVIEWWVDILLGDESFRLLLSREILSPRVDEPGDLFHAVFHDAIDVFTSAVRAAIPEADPNEAVAAVFSLSYGLASFRGIYEIFPTARTRPKDAREIAEEVTHLLLHGLHTRA